MISNRAKGWKWYDWLFVLAAVLVICPLVAAAVHSIAPGSPVSNAIHTGAHAIAYFFQLAAGGLNAIAGWLNSL